MCAAEAVLEEAGVMGVAPLWVGLDLGAGVVGVVCSAVLFCPFCNTATDTKLRIRTTTREAYACALLVQY